MPETWIYIAGGILTGILVLTIAYQLILSSIDQMQSRNFISDFNNFETDLESLCYQERGTSATYDITIPYSVRVIYTTDDVDNPPPTVTDKIFLRKESSGYNICIQFKAEQDLRCSKLSCNTTIPYMGSLETYNDLQLLVSQILGRPLSKTYTLKIVKEQAIVRVEDSSCKTEGEACSLEDACCFEANYCWALSEDSEYMCHANCATDGSYAIDGNSCCSKNRNSTSGQCLPASVTFPSTTMPGIVTTEPIGPPTGGEEFVLLFIQMRSEIPDFESKAEEAKNKFVAITPLKSCPSNVKAIIVSDKVCNTPSQAGVCGSNSGRIVVSTIEKLIQCADEWGYSGKYTRIIGVEPGGAVCQDSTGYICGYTMLYAEAVVSSEGNSPRLKCRLYETSPHELGHTFGLCDEGYGNTPSSSCDSGYCAGDCRVCDGSLYCCPNKPEPSSIMCSAAICPGRHCSDGSTFAPTSYAHLETELNMYCGG